MFLKFEIDFVEYGKENALNQPVNIEVEKEQKVGAKKRQKIKINQKYLLCIKLKQIAFIERRNLFSKSFYCSNLCI